MPAQIAFCSMSASGELPARPCGMRALLAQATVRALVRGGGRGDPCSLTVFHDLGAAGLPLPDLPCGNESP